VTYKQAGKVKTIVWVSLKAVGVRVADRPSARAASALAPKVMTHQLMVVRTRGVAQEFVVARRS
jgi:hypothetical protein